MRQKVLLTGIGIGAFLPAVVIVLGGLSTLIHGCAPGGSGGPAFGCYAGGVDLNWLIGLVTPAFMLSFLTVPIGILVFIAGLFVPARKL